MNMRFKRGIFSGIVMMSFVLTVTGAVLADTPAPDFKTSIFEKADNARKTAEDKEALKYAPKAYNKGMKYYNKAEEDFDAGKSVGVVQKKLDEAIKHFTEASEAADEAANVFSPAIIARKDAQAADAPKYAPDTWEKAEDKFQDAMEIYEEGQQPKRAKRKGEDATELYRDAELISIEKKYLQVARDLLERAKDTNAKRYAPRTVEKATLLAYKANELLKKNRYETTEAEKLAKEAEHEARHAIYLNETVRTLKKEKSYEDILLEYETPIREIASGLDIDAQFDQGIDTPVREILVAIKNLKAENESLALTIKNSGADISELAQQRAEKDKIIREKDSEILGLRQKIQALETRMRGLMSDKEKLSSEARREQIRRAKIARIEAAFGPDEAAVMQDVDENIIVRLYGLSFPKGMSVIEPKYFSLLAKVNDAISQFPNCRLVIEGHTDSTGSTGENLKLSGQRATAVQEYILANTEILRERVKAVGYGEKRPVASNESAEGRAKNRRIDIVIKPVE